MSTTQPIGLSGLLQPRGGMFTSNASFPSRGMVPDFTTHIVQLGDLTQVRVPIRASATAPRVSIAGSGTGDEEEGAFLALAEGLERYCTCIYNKDQFILCTAAELGDDSLDLNTIPKCSETELSHPLCPLTVPDRHKPIRWVRSISLLDGRLVYVPVVMVYLQAGLAASAERISLPITTGCAAHQTYERALTSAILEVVERDAISVTWLQKLPLPRIEIDDPSLLGHYWQKYERSAKGLEYHFFDATSALGFPTIYGVQVAPADKRLTTLVSCSTDLNPATAVTKVIRDMSAIRIAFRNPRIVPETWDEFTDIFDGAAYMARSEQRHAFDFLLNAASTKPLSGMGPLGRGNDADTLRLILGRLRQHGLDAFAVDLTTDEAIRCGVRVVRVLIPGLQPLSFHYRGRYLGHPRLYNAPREMGYAVRTEDQLNEWPQPFA